MLGRIQRRPEGGMSPPGDMEAPATWIYLSGGAAELRRRHAEAAMQPRIPGTALHLQALPSGRNYHRGMSFSGGLIVRQTPHWPRAREFEQSLEADRVFHFSR